MKKSFSFKGLTRNSDDLLVADGECMELVNMSMRDGCMFPVSSHYDETELAGAYSKLFWHVATQTLLCLLSDGSGRVHFYDKEYNLLAADDGGAELFPQLSGVVSVEFLDNVVCCVTDCTTFYLIYKSGKYVWLGERPEMPDMMITYKSAVETLVTDEEYMWGVSGDTSGKDYMWTNAAKGYLDQCLSQLHGKGYYVDRALFRCALRLYDGSHICHSQVYYVDDDSVINNMARDRRNFATEAVNSNPGTYSKHRVKILGFLPEFVFTQINLDAWENIVVGIDVFSSGSIYGHRVAGGAEFDSSSGGFDRYVDKTDRELMSDVTGAALFYRVAEFDIRGVAIDRLKDVSLSSLALCERLGDDDEALCGRGAAYSYLFNGRLHLAGVNEMFFKGYGYCSYVPSGADEAVADYAVVATKIKTTQGEALVKREFEKSLLVGVKEGVYYISPYLMYPDARAVEIIFAIKLGDVIYKKVFSLKKHASLNAAFFVNGYGLGAKARIEGTLLNGSKPAIYSMENVVSYFSGVPGSYVITYDGSKWYYGDQLFEHSDGLGTLRLVHFLNPVAGDSFTIVIEECSIYERNVAIEDIAIDSSWEVVENFDGLDEVNICERRGNVLKVSAVGNPFVFPAKNTYEPSKEDILAVCSNTMALSQGQFGEHPLLVFCCDGIWALSCDASGALVYSAAHPLSREVCLSGESLCSVDSGVVFVGQRGLMLLQGSSIGLLSGALDSRSQPMPCVTDGDIFCRIASAAGVALPVGDVSFADYLTSAVVGYIAAENELWVSSPAHSYSYVYSLSSRVWAKADRSYCFFADKYPYQLGLRTVGGKSRVGVLHRDFASSSAGVLLFTRPQMWGTKLPKRILQFILHASVRMGKGDSLLCCLLCSNDGVHFKLVDARERVGDFNDLVFSYFPTHSYKYYVIALSGRVKVESRIVGAELSVATAWENRLR